MDADRWRRVEELYHSARLRDPGERAAYLAEACGGDRELQQEVESLLRQDVSRSGPLDRPAWEGASSLLRSPPLGETAVSLETELPQSGETGSGHDPHEAPGRQNRFLWIVRLAALVTIASFGYAAAGLVKNGGIAKTFGWSEQQRGDAWFVDSVDPAGPAAGRLQRGDRLLSLNADSFVAAAGTGPYRRSFQIGDTYQLSVLRDGNPRELTLAAASGSRRLANHLTWYAVSLVWCGVGLFIGFMRPDRLQARLAFLSAIATGLVFLQVGTFQGNLALWQPLHAVLGYHFFYRFPSGAPPGRFWTALLWLLYGGGAFGAATRQPVNWTALTEGPSGVT